MPWWWQQLVAAGGLAWMDVAAIHPYTGSNDSYDEDGIPAQVRQVQALLGAKPLWFTEVGWWSDGDYDYLAQADDMASSLVWQKVLGVPVENYFFDEGSWGNDGISFSLIQTSSGDDYVKPAALATMTTTGLLAGRPYVSMPATGIPHAYQADFGATSGGGTDVAAVWTDGLPVTATVTLTSPGGSTDPVTVTTEYGSATTVQAASGTAYSLPLSGQVAYLTYPAGDTLTVGPTEAYGTDVASAAAGATATRLERHGRLGHHRQPRRLRATAGPRPAATPPPASPTPSPRPTTIDRIVVDTQSVGSTASSVRNYTLSADVNGTVDHGGHRDGPVPRPRPAVRLRPRRGHGHPDQRVRGQLRRLLRRRDPALVAGHPDRPRLPPHLRGLRRHRRPGHRQRLVAAGTAGRQLGGDGWRHDHHGRHHDDHHDDGHDDDLRRPPPRTTRPPPTTDDDHRAVTTTTTTCPPRPPRPPRRSPTTTTTVPTTTTTSRPADRPTTTEPPTTTTTTTRPPTSGPGTSTTATSG